MPVLQAPWKSRSGKENNWTEFISVKKYQRRRYDSLENICLLSCLMNHHKKFKCSWIASMGADRHENGLLVVCQPELQLAPVPGR